MRWVATLGRESKETLYFGTGGGGCTDDTLVAAVERALDLEITHIVVATSSGATALSLLDEIERRGGNIKVVAVTYHAGYKHADSLTVSEDVLGQLRSRGARVVATTHALSGLSRSFSNKFGGSSIPEVLAEAYRRISQGFKVAIECSIMAADSGTISTQEDVIAIGGSGSGADTAIVLKACNMNSFFDLKVREIIAMPRA